MANKTIHAPSPNGGIFCREFGDGRVAEHGGYINCKACAKRLFANANYGNVLRLQGYRVAQFPEPKPKRTVIDPRQLDLASAVQ